MLFYDVRFWSCDENISVKPTDLRTFKYENRKNYSANTYNEAKQKYCERRGQHWFIPSKKPLQLKDRLQEVIENIKNNQIIYCSWQNESYLCLIFCSGLICYIHIEKKSGDISKILFDRFCIGKLPHSNVIGAIFTSTHLMFIYPENQALLISFNKPSFTNSRLEKISRRDPKCQTIELYGPARKCDRRISFYDDPVNPKVLIWSPATPGEVFPWSPNERGEDRANIHVYSLKRSQITLDSFHRIEYDPLSVELSKIYENIVYTVEQKNSQKGSLSVECCSYEVCARSWSRRTRATLPAPAPPRACQRSVCESRLVLCCVDGSLLLHSETANVTRIVKASFIPSAICCLRDCVVIADDRGRLQCLDMALNVVPLGTTQHAQFIDLSSYFKQGWQPILRMFRSNYTQPSSESYDNLLFVTFEDGPLSMIRIATTDIGLRWLESGKTERAISLLRSLNWETEGNSCLHLLHNLVNNLLRSPLSVQSEMHIQEALGTFHAPHVPLSEACIAEYGPQLHDLSRRFFHHLVRYGQLDKALSLAVDLAAVDLFVDARHAATRTGLPELAEEALTHARNVVSQSDDHSSCSASSCSQCASGASDSEMSLDEADFMPQANKKEQEMKIIPRLPPPLPKVPKMDLNIPTQPVLVMPSEPSTSHSIRPNIHQYLDRECSLWTNLAKDFDPKMTKYNAKPTHHVIDILPKPVEDNVLSHHYNNIYQTELAEETIFNNPPRIKNGTDGKLNNYKSVYNKKSTMLTRYNLNPQFQSSYMQPVERSMSSMKLDTISEMKVSSAPKSGTEKNKVKFSDTVTIAVVPEIPRKDKINPNMDAGQHSITDPRKELADSLPLCHPNDDYLKDFAPVTNTDKNKNNHEVPTKIKVVHFGMV